MVEEYDAPPQIDPPPSDWEAAVVAAPPAPCRICLTEEFVTSDRFDSFPSLLQSCRGENPVEVSIQHPNGQRRRWQLPGLTVNSKNLSAFIRVLPGASLDE